MHLCNAKTLAALQQLLAEHGIRVARIAVGASIPGSYWGEPEAGLIGSTVYVRDDTPLHSALHEAAHVICMDSTRRARLHTNAGGDFAEENAVCYLQILLAAALGVAEAAICADMDAWGYTFRLGSAYAWFTQDADDARQWLIARGLLAS